MGKKDATVFRSVRSRAWRNLMVSAINVGLERGYFGLKPEENFWLRESFPATSDGARLQHGLIVFDFAVAGLPARAAVGDAGHGELMSIAVVNPRVDWLACCMHSATRLAVGDAYADGWFERKAGPHLQYDGIGGAGFACRKGLVGVLSHLCVEPAGYKDHGWFFL